MSDDRPRETEDLQDSAEVSSDTPQPAAAVRRARSSRSTQSERSDGLGKEQPTRARGATETKVGLPARLMRFLREVVSELRKVIWPTRRELVVYTAVVLVFVTVMVTFVALLDMGLGRAVLAVFG
ncbi:MAG: preprotein translocase subunit SecE [Pseudonocardiaceae bacterium]